MPPLTNDNTVRVCECDSHYRGRENSVFTGKMVGRKKKDVVVTSIKDEFIEHSIEVTPFAE